MPNAFSYDRTLYSVRLLLRHSSFFSLLRHRHRFSMWATQILLTTHAHTRLVSKSQVDVLFNSSPAQTHKNHRFFESRSLFFSFRFSDLCQENILRLVRNNKRKNMIRSSSWNYFNNLLWTNIHRMEIHCELCMHIYLDNEDGPNDAESAAVAWADGRVESCLFLWK